MDTKSVKYLRYLFSIILFAIAFLVHVQPLAASPLSLPTPEGCIEVRSGSLSGFPEALATEASHQGDVLLQAWIRQSEQKALDTKDFYTVSMTVQALVFQPDGSCTEKRMAKLLKNLLPKGAVHRERFLEHLRCPYRKSIQAFLKDGTVRPPFPQSPPDAEAVTQWLSATPQTLAEALPIGVMHPASGTPMFVWLERADGWLTRGLTKDAPRAVVFVPLPVGKETVGLLFASIVENRADVDTLCTFASEYLKELGPKPDVALSSAIPSEQVLFSNFSVLSHASKLWYNERRAPPAWPAYERLIRQFDDLGLKPHRYWAEGCLMESYFWDGQYVYFQERFPETIAWMESMLPGIHTEATVSLYTLMGGIYALQDKNDLARDMFEKGVAASLEVYGERNLVTCSVMGEYSRNLSFTGQSEKAMKVAENVWEIALELDSLSDIGAGIQHTLVALLSQEKHSEISFLCKIGAGLVSYAKESSGGLNEEFLDNQVLLATLDHIVQTLQEQGKSAPIDAFWKQPNKPGDTHWNKARPWMQGEEVALYERYGEVAKALSEAGRSGNARAKEKARNDFRAWMQAVRDTLQ